MICCFSCPFYPTKSLQINRCPGPICKIKNNEPHECTKLSVTRCFLDHYVINKLYQNDPLAEQLAPITLKKALIGRDRAMLLSLFHAANHSLKLELFAFLENYEPRSLWLLNPIFSAAGLLPINSFASASSQRQQYLNAIVSNPYSSSRYESHCHLNASQLSKRSSYARLY